MINSPLRSGDGLCVITEKDRGCKKCRYERCCAAGMNTNLVLAIYLHFVPQSAQFPG